MEITWSTRPELPGSSCGPNTQGRKRAASKHIENNEGRKRQGRKCQAGNALVSCGHFVIIVTSKHKGETMIKKLLDTAKKSGNTKVAKTGAKHSPLGDVRMAQLSMMPDNILCAGSKAAGCMDDCLKSSGLAAVYKSVNKARQSRTDYWHADQFGFIEQIARELRNFSKTCTKQKVKGVVRLNVLSDIAWEKHGIPQQFPELFFYDYTKRANRLGKTPPNYKLMFSYSARHQYRKQVLQAICHDVPIAAVFKNGMPDEFLGREVIDGDQSDLWNVHAGKVVVGLKAKGPAKHNTNGFVVDMNAVPTFTVEA